MNLYGNVDREEFSARLIEAELSSLEVLAKWKEKIKDEPKVEAIARLIPLLASGSEALEGMVLNLMTMEQFIEEFDEEDSEEARHLRDVGYAIIQDSLEKLTKLIGGVIERIEAG